MLLQEAINAVLLESSDYTDAATNFDVTVKRGGDSEHIQRVFGSFTNEHGDPVKCIIGFVNDYTIKLSITVNSERIANPKGLFKSLRACTEFYKRFLNSLLDRVPKQQINLIYFDQKNPLGEDIHDTLVKKVVAPAINSILNADWEEVGRYVATRGKSVYLWKRRNLGKDKRSLASKSGPEMEPSWYKSNRPDVSDPKDLRTPTDKDREEYQNQTDKIEKLRSKMYSKECAIRMVKVGIELQEALIQQFPVKSRL